MAYELVRRGLMVLVLILPVSLNHAAVYRDLDRIVAVVDEEVVLWSEVRLRVSLIRDQMRANGMRVPTDNVMMSQVLERLILESIQLQMAERGGMRISDQELTDSIDAIAGRNGMSMDQFREALAGDGVSYPQFREQVRRDIIMNQVQRNQVERRIYISEQELENYLAWATYCLPSRIEPMRQCRRARKPRPIRSIKSFSMGRTSARWRFSIRLANARSSAATWVGVSRVSFHLCLPIV